MTSKISKEKTLITGVRKKYIKFLGYQFKLVPGKAGKGYISRTIPDKDRLKRKVYEIAESIKKIPHSYSKEKLIGEMHRINSKIRGLIQYYQCCTWVNVSMKKYSIVFHYYKKEGLPASGLIEILQREPAEVFPAGTPSLRNRKILPKIDFDRLY